MKNIKITIGIITSLLVFLNASVWEGAGALGGDLPENGLYIATNSYPINTVVEVTNLENGVIAYLMVYSGLESSGLLAHFSKDAALAIGLVENYICRIRMQERTNMLPPSYFGGSRIFTFNGTGGNETGTAGSKIVNEANEAAEVIWDKPIEVAEQVNNLPVVYPESIIAKPEQPQFIEPVKETPISHLAHVFSVPVITYFEPGKYYVQIAAYSRTESAEYELSRIDKALPRTVMAIGNETKPIYRVLIGPLNIGESGAVLQRYKSIYKDAFVWQGR